MLRGISGVRSISASPVRGDLRVARLSARTEGVLERACARSAPPSSLPLPSDQCLSTGGSRLSREDLPLPDRARVRLRDPAPSWRLGREYSALSFPEDIAHPPCFLPFADLEGLASTRLPALDIALMRSAPWRTSDSARTMVTTGILMVLVELR